MRLLVGKIKMNMLIISRLVAAACLAVSFLASPVSALLDEGRVTAAKQAADEFLRKAEGSEKTGIMPRRSEPDVARLLDKIFGLSGFGIETVPISQVGPIGEIARNGNRVGLIYILAGTGLTELSGGVSRDILLRVDQNTVTFAPELGQFMDFQMVTTEAMARSALGFVASATPEQLERPQVKSGFAQMRSGFTQTISGVLKTLTIAGLGEDWKRERLAGLDRLAATASRFLDQDNKATLKRLVDGVALLVPPDLKPRVLAFGEQVAEAPR